MTRPAAELPPRDPKSSGSAGLGDARTLRPGSSIAVGVVGVLAGLALLVPAVLTSPRNWTIIASVVLALVLLWLFVIRPCARIHADGIRLVNPMRVVDLTWPAITEVRSKWALELFSGGTRYTAWGIPADPKRPRYGRNLIGLGANKIGAQAAPAEKGVKVEAQTVAAEVEARMAADRGRKDGRTPKVSSQAWDPGSVGLLLCAVAFFVIAVFIA